jgi:hypothetical protein
MGGVGVEGELLRRNNMGGNLGNRERYLGERGVEVRRMRFGVRASFVEASVEK